MLSVTTANIATRMSSIQLVDYLEDGQSLRQSQDSTERATRLYWHSPFVVFILRSLLREMTSLVR